jgi:trigger factor
VKIKIEDMKGSQKLIRVEVDADRVNGVLEQAYSDIQKKAFVPGYRQGKAPRDLIEANYGKTAHEESANRLVWDCYREAVAQKGIKPVGYPVISDVDFKDNKALVFSARVDIYPDIRLKQYKDIKVKEKSYEVTDDDIEKALNQLQESYAKYKDIEPRPVKKQDYLVCAYECFENGKLIDKKDKLWLYISDKLQPKELLDALIGSAIGEQKEVHVKYPKDYEYKELAGKDRLYRVNPSQIKEKILPEINDELAKLTGNFAGLKELKKALEENILNSKKLEARQDLENQIYSFLLKGHDFDVPESFVENQSSRLLDQAKQRLVQQGYKKEDINEQDEKLKESMRPQAADNVRLFFLIDKIARQEKIEVETEEIEKKIAEIAAQSGEALESVKAKIKDKGLMDNIKEQILHDKTVEFLIDNAKKN